MTTFYGLAPATGPLSPAPYVPTPLRGCGCGEQDDCRRCNGDAEDEAELSWAYQQAASERARLMRTDPEYRASWLSTFGDPAMRARMAADADRRYGVLRTEDKSGAAA